MRKCKDFHEVLTIPKFQKCETAKTFCLYIMCRKARTPIGRLSKFQKLLLRNYLKFVACQQILILYIIIIIIIIHMYVNFIITVNSKLNYLP